MNDSNLDVVVRGRDELSPELRRIESSVIRMVGAISAALATIRIGTAPIVAAAQFEAEMANVAKTTDFVSKKLEGQIGTLDRLGDALLNMSLRVNVSAVDLAKIAGAAGQLGFADKLGVDGVIQFTDSVSRMASVLDISAAKAATELGKILNIFKTPIRDIEKAISIVNEVSNKSTASGEELLDVIKRIGDAAGSLNLEQAAAVSATGIDFGLSPEVVGTGFSKAFSAMREDADKFGRVVKGIVTSTGEIMDGSAAQWIKTVQTDGIEALKVYLKGLRKLEVQSQQQAIVKLVGGGRIGALFNKLVQDVSDSVLDKALSAAKEGGLGVSALKEQATVMFTLNKQAEILRNSLFKLGVDSTGAFLPQLTQLTAQLSHALQTPEFQSFVNSVIGGFTKFITVVGGVVKAVASLNVNWENFINVLLVFMGVKLAQSFGSLLGSVSVFGTSLKSISKDADTAATSTKKLGAAATEAAAATAAAANVTKGARLAEALGLTGVIAKYKEYRAALEAQRIAGGELRNAQTTQRVANTAVANTNAVVARTPPPVASTTNLATAIPAQQGALAAVQASANAADIARRQAHAVTVARIEAEKAANLLQIKTAYDTRYAVIAATGTEIGLKKLRAEKAHQLAETEAHYQRALRSTNAYHAKKALIDAAAGAQEIERERLQLAKLRLERLQGNVASNASAGALAAAGGATIAAGAAATGLADAEAKVARTALAAKKAGSAVDNFGVALGAIAAFIVKAGKILVGGLLWATVIYSIVDALGGVDLALKYIGPAFQKFTDWLGLTSKSSRDAKIGLEETAKAAAKSSAEYDEAAEAYKRYIDITTGKPDQAKLNGLLNIVKTSPNVEDQRTALENLTGGAQALLNQKGRAEQQQNQVIPQDLAKLQATLDAAKAKYAEFAAYAEKKLSFVPKDQKYVRDYYENLLKPLQDNVDRARKAMGSLAPAQENAAAAAIHATESLVQYQAALGSTMDMARKEALEKFLPAIYISQKAIDDAMKSQDANQKALRDGGGVALKEAVDKQVQELFRLQKANADARKEAREFVDQLAKTPGIKPEIVEQWRHFLAEFTGLKTPAMGTVLALLPQITPAQVTNTNPPKPPPKTSGTDTVVLKGESKADKEQKLALARIALRKAELEAANRKSDEADRQHLDMLQERYSRGLIATKEYYDRIEVIRTKAINNDIKSKNLELDAIDKELEGNKKKKDKLEGLQLAARKVAIEGEIAVLESKRSALPVENDRQEIKDKEEFDGKLLATRNRLISEGLIPTSVTDGVQSNLQEMLHESRQFLDKLREEGHGALAKAILAGFDVAAVQKGIEPVRKEIDFLFANLAQTKARIDLAQSNGSLTSMQAAIGYSDEIKRQLPLLREQLALQVKQLETTRQSGPVQSLVWRELAANVDRTRLQIEELGAQTDLVARDINANLSASIEGALNDLLTFGNTFKDVFKSLLSNIAKSVQNLIVRDMTEGLMKTLSGPNVLGGLGGFMKRLFEGNSPSAATAMGATAKVATSIVEPAGVAGTLLGSAALPSHVIVDNLGALGVLGGKSDAPSISMSQVTATGTPVDATGVVQGAEPGPLGSLLATITGLGTKLATTLTDVFTKLGTGLLSLFRGPKLGEAASAGGGLIDSLRSVAGGVTTSPVAPQTQINPVDLPSLVGGEVVDNVGAFSTATEESTAIIQGNTGAAKGMSMAFKLMDMIFGAGTSTMVTSFLGMSTSTITGAGAVGGLASAAVAATVALGQMAAAAQVSMITSAFHTGGIVGQSGGMTRNVSPMLFANAPRYHVGGVAGLRPGEVPAILKKGEAVLTQNQQSLVAASMHAPKSGGMGEVNIRNVLVADPSFVTDALNSAQGEKTMMSFLTRNRTSIRQTLG